MRWNEVFGDTKDEKQAVKRLQYFQWIDRIQKKEDEIACAGNELYWLLFGMELNSLE